jgi:hypothetical protein
MAPSRACQILSASSLHSLRASSRRIQSRSVGSVLTSRTRTIRTSPTTSHPAYCNSSKSVHRALTLFDRIPLQSPRIWPSFSLHHAALRSYSSSAAQSPVKTSARPEAPDFLDEKEKAIFDRLSDALEPTELEV